MQLNEFERHFIKRIVSHNSSFFNSTELNAILKLCREEKVKILSCSVIDEKTFNAITSLEEKIMAYE